MTTPMATPNATRGDVIVGIDLGTTNSLVAVCDEFGPRVLLDESNRALLPSVVRYDATPRPVVGHDAKSRAADFPHTTISSVKRLMGRSLRDAQRDALFLPYRLFAGENDTARISLPLPSGERIVSPQEVSAEILARLRTIAEKSLAREVRRAVVTVPAYFDDSQRQATRDAGRLAGLEVVRIINEPTAAALAYGLSLPRAKNAPSSHVVVYDLGGGTFDVSVLRLIPGAHADRDAFQVLATSGDTRLGGDDIDHALAEVLAREIAPGAPLTPEFKARLMRACEEAKVALSDAPRTTITLDTPAGPYRRELTRNELDALASPLVDRTLAACRRALADAGMLDDSGTPRLAIPGDHTHDDLADGIGVVVLVGGATRMPLVRERVAKFFGLPPYTALDPDRVVALGAAVQGAILSGRNSSALLLDVIPLSLGLETRGGGVAKLILRNSAVPARAAEMFSTSVDGQTSIRFSVFQGEREMAADCRRLAEFHLRGIPPMPAGIPQVEVTFLVDANGVLNVSAHERRSGKRAELQVVPNHGLSRDEVERLERESVLFAREDMTRHRVADLITHSKLDLKWIGDGLARLRQDLDPAYADDLSRGLDALRALVSAAEFDWRSVNPDLFHKTKEALERASVRLQEISIARSLREER